MEHELLYLIGEAVLTEVDGVKDVFYPQNETNTCVIVADDNRRYKITLEELA